SLISAMLITVFIATTLFFISVYYKTLKYLEKSIIKQPSQKELDSETLERLKNKLIDDEEVKNLEEMIYRMQTLRREAEEILNDSEKSQGS
ncbi:MAG: hypothetical protein QXO45_06995, partial [Nitrososphaerota archaeon]